MKATHLPSISLGNGNLRAQRRALLSSVPWLPIRQADEFKHFALAGHVLNFVGLRTVARAASANCRT
jgi:hypothetical protein